MEDNNPKLESVQILGYRSIQETTLEFRPLNILIGANGAGKSNLISFFKMLNELIGERFQQHIAATGHGTANLYFGPKTTPQMEATLKFRTDRGTNTYRMRLFHVAGDTLMFAEETLSYQQSGYPTPRLTELGAGHKETMIGKQASENDPTAGVLRRLLSRCRVFHFHDTSSTARVRQHCYIGDDRWLMPDAGNLAAILYRLSQENEISYRRIVATIRQVAPFFDDFVFEPTGSGNRHIILNWRHRQSDSLFGPHQFSDGTLRAICLIALLMQPLDDLPYLIVVDEPELGLHPYALDVIASLFQIASHTAQILISTQSSVFLDSFEPEDVVVVERDGETSRFFRPNVSELESWLEDYSLGEVWEKNVIGGGPH